MSHTTLTPSDTIVAHNADCHYPFDDSRIDKIEVLFFCNTEKIPVLRGMIATSVFGGTTKPPELMFSINLNDPDFRHIVKFQVVMGERCESITICTPEQFKLLSRSPLATFTPVEPDRVAKYSEIVKFPPIRKLSFFACSPTSLIVVMPDDDIHAALASFLFHHP